MRPGRQFAGRQSQGARPYQEDNWAWQTHLSDDDSSPHGLLLVLADGMGGHRGGARASAVAVDAFIDAYGDSEGAVSERLLAALEASNRRIGEESHADPDLAGMGCTLLAVDFREDGMRWISVGDSPLWLLRGDKLRRLNEDHSMAPLLQRQVELGTMSYEEAALHPQRNALRSALVGEPLELVDLAQDPLVLEADDRVLLGSDGVETLAADEIVAVAGVSAASGDDAETIATRLIEAVDARQRAGQDNATVVVVLPFQGARASILPARRRNWAGRRLAPILVVLGILAAGGFAAWQLMFGAPLQGGTGTPVSPAGAGPAPGAGRP